MAQAQGASSQNDYGFNEWYVVRFDVPCTCDLVSLIQLLTDPISPRAVLDMVEHSVDGLLVGYRRCPPVHDSPCPLTLVALVLVSMTLALSIHDRYDR